MSPSSNPQRARQSGLTLLEVLIALSIFATMGVTSYRLLAGVIQTQQRVEQHSAELNQLQRAVSVLDRDFLQWRDRAIRIGAESQPGLLLEHDDYAVVFSRGGWSNPLRVSRSSLQRVAYDLGPHPAADDKASPAYGDQRQYLRRHYWPHLDRVSEHDERRRIQPLLAAVATIKITVISEQGRHLQWPLEQKDDEEPLTATAIEIELEHEALGSLTRLFKLD